ncbi:4'-phosphopantetheinyl transferase family protein [Photobacterium sanguinicancri]|uniref:Enterobactin synthase component D n=1 Tax=Photobacterium sanguinicancri TaxID=875932 RepID=A0ABX4FT34_9GAMM|nr:4'-phosphopantetheinyl transferase superfamily protein [Photobacterium sanguinicancri]MDO6496573.1 4'-phosphopantetheinyl transferase superfamily protein [Photobacterium sanguinicancri]OZS41495.1 hypothetical protein ASV53_23400 [Photobacterium sanguinicancri]
MLIPNFPSLLEFQFLNVDYSQNFISAMLMEGADLPDTLNKAVLKRQCEFLAGRVCAQRGLYKLGKSSVASIKIGEFRQPLWPNGVVGSISHCSGHAIAMVGMKSDECVSVGIDIEEVINALCAREIANQVLSKSESVFAELFEEFQYFLTLIFSAKESIYKAIFPFVKQILDFDCVRLIAVDTKNGELKFQFSYFLFEALYPNVVVNYHFCNANTVMTWCTLSTHNLKFAADLSVS